MVSVPSPASSIPRSSSSPFRWTSMSGDAARAFMTLTSVWPPARARAPSFAARSSTASPSEGGREYPTSRRSNVRRLYKIFDPRGASRLHVFSGQQVAVRGQRGEDVVDVLDGFVGVGRDSQVPVPLGGDDAFGGQAPN